MIFGFFCSPEREARGLQRDARLIIDDVCEAYRDQLLNEIAKQIYIDLLHIDRNCQSELGSRKRELERHTSLHRDARRKFNPVALTAHTLVIIHLRATALGEPGQGVIEVINEFTEAWRSDEGQVS